MRKYPKYKPSDIEWIGDIPEHWEVEKLRYIGNFTSSGIDKKINKDEPLVKIINYTDIYGNSTRLLTSERNYMEVSCPEEKRVEHKVKKGDLVFTPSSETTEDIGLSALVDEDLENTAYSYHVLRFRFDKEVDHSFKKYLCNNYFILNQFSANAKGTTRKILNRENFNSALVIIPPKPEQAAIANLLDEKTAQIDKLITNKQKLIELLKQERTGIINRAVTRGINPNVKLKPSGIEWLGDIPEHWEIKKLKYILRVKSGDGIKSEEIDFEGTYPVYGGNGIMGYTENYNSDRLDIIIGRVGAKCGNVRLVNGKKWISDNALVADLFEGYVYKLISILLESINLNSLANQNAQPLITGTLVRDKIVAIPSNIKEQDEIVQYIEIEAKRIDGTISKIEKEIELLQEYRTALISEVVTGKIKVM